MDKTQEFINYMISKQKFGDKRLEEYAQQNYVPIVKRDTANMLRLIVAMLKPRRVLEIGTAIGYSAKIMLDACADLHLTTLEIDYDRFMLAKKNLKKYEPRVDIVLCDADDYLLNCEQKFDLIFLDGAKAQYLGYLPSILRLLDDGAVLVADNVLQEGMTAGAVPTKHKLESTIDRMHKFLNMLFTNKSLCSTILPIGDGLSISVKSQN